MKIRFATLEDAHAIAGNNVELAKESENMEISFEETLRGVKELIMDRQKGFYIVAEEEGKVAGQMMITYEWSDWRGRQIWWLQSIYVKREYRRKGIMKMLLEEAIKMAQQEGVALLRLYVHKDNKNAMEAYKKVGMKKAPYIIYEMEMEEKIV